MKDSDFNESLNSNQRAIIKRFEEALALGEQVYIEEDQLEEIVLYYQDSTQLEKALQAADYGIENYRFSGIFQMKKAEVFLELALLEDALFWLQEAELFIPGDLEIALIRAEIHFVAGEVETAISLLEEELERRSANEERLEIYLQLAELYEDLDLYMEVIDCLEEVLAVDITNQEALQQLWFAVEISEAYERGVEINDALIERDPYCFWAWRNKAHALKGLGLTEKAREMFDFALAIDENHIPTLIDCGHMLFLESNYSEAIPYFEEALDGDSENRNLHLWLGLSYCKTGRLNEGRRQFRQAIEIDPLFAEAFFAMGQSFVNEGQYGKAIVAIERACKLSPETKKYRIAQARALVSLGGDEEGINQLWDLVGEFRSDGNIWLLLAQFTAAKQGFLEVPSILQTGIDQAENHLAELYYYLVAVYIKTGQKQMGLHWLEEAYALYPKKLKLLEMYAPEWKDSAFWSEVISRISE